MTRPDPAAIPARPRRRRLAPLLAALAMFGPFSIDTIFPAFPAIQADLHASPFAMKQTISVYMVAYALTAAAKVGRRSVPAMLVIIGLAAPAAR